MGVIVGEGQEHWINAPDGLALFVHEYLPRPPQTGLPVLCLHGLTRNSRDFERVGPRIAALGRRVLAMDVRGRGRSDRDGDPSHYAPPVYVRDALHVLDALDVEEAIWIGTSMGGIMTMIAAASAPQRVAAALLNDVGPQLDPAGLVRIGGYVGHGEVFAGWAEAVDAIAASQGQAFPRAQPGFMREFAHRLCRERADGRVEFDYDPAIALPFRQPGGAAPMDMTPLFDALNEVPLLVVRGALSDLLSADGLRFMQARRPDLEWVEVADIGHAPTLEEPAAWDAVLDFLARAP